jgi:acyl-ACP thioesterase
VTPFEELVPHPGIGRVYEEAMLAGLADAAPGGRVRLDAMARWLQDVALNDVVDAGVGESALWVVRRARIAVARWPRFGDAVTLRTWSAGMGRMWAQRRTDMAIGDEVAVQAAAVWVHLDPATGRPTPLSPAELEIYAPSAAGREARARLHHPAPAAEAASVPWTFRSTELDIADHVNNTAYWAPLEAELLAGAAEPAALDVEIEHKTPAQPGAHRFVADGPHRWVVDEECGAVRASFCLAV